MVRTVYLSTYIYFMFMVNVGKYTWMFWGMFQKFSVECFILVVSAVFCVGNFSMPPPQKKKEVKNRPYKRRCLGSCCFQILLLIFDAGISWHIGLPRFCLPWRRQHGFEKGGEASLIFVVFPKLGEMIQFWSPKILRFLGSTCSTTK